MIAGNIMQQVQDKENFIADDKFTEEEKETVRKEITEFILLVTPTIENIYRVFYLFVDDEIKEFVEKYDIVIIDEKEMIK